MFFFPSFDLLSGSLQPPSAAIILCVETNKYHSLYDVICRQVLKCLGEDTRREGILKTPSRYRKALAQMLSGYAKTAQNVLGDAIFNEETLAGNRQTVCVGNIEFYSTDAHTLMPFFGEVHICYLPDEGKVAGLSKFARITEVFSKRLQTPKNLARDIASSIETLVSPVGVLVVIKCVYLNNAICAMHKSGSGIPGDDVVMTEVEQRGLFLDQKCKETREMLGLIGLSDLTTDCSSKGEERERNGNTNDMKSSGSPSTSLAHCFDGYFDELLSTRRQSDTERENTIKNLIFQIYTQAPYLAHLNGSSVVSRDMLWNASSFYANWLLKMTSGSFFSLEHLMQVVRSDQQQHAYDDGDDSSMFRKYRNNSYHVCELYSSVGSICEHHILPFFGKVYISLLGKKREVDVTMRELQAITWKYSRQLQLQERLVSQIADALEKHFPSIDGVFVCMSGYHHCMRARGAEKTSAKTLSFVTRGFYQEDEFASMECIKRFRSMADS